MPNAFGLSDFPLNLESVVGAVRHVGVNAERKSALLVAILGSTNLLAMNSILPCSSFVC